MPRNYSTHVRSTYLPGLPDCPQTYLFSVLVSWPAQLVVYGYWFYTQAWVMWFDYFWNGSYTKAMQVRLLSQTPDTRHPTSNREEREGRGRER